MPKPIPPKLFGLAACGLISLATPAALGQGGPAPSAPPSTTESPAATPELSVLMLNSGKVIRGKITRDPAGNNYFIKEQGASIGYPAAMVAKAAGSMEELYQYRLGRLATRDADERMKLARWCLTEGMPHHAKEQIAAVLQLSPGDPVAVAMQDKIAANDEKMAGQLDPEVRRTKVDEGDAPGQLAPAAIKRVRKDFGRGTFPEIFDLPRGQAIVQAQRFTTTIHPILQNRCATCHNERYPGRFQMVAAKAKREVTSEVARNNLDAALQLVNPDDLSRSDLLSSGLVPHGGNKDAIFRGPNDVEYQRIAQWVRALRPAPTPGGTTARAGQPGTPGAMPGGFMPVPAGQEGFATDRAARPEAPGAPVTPLVPVPPDNGLPPLPGGAAAAPGMPPANVAAERYDLDIDYQKLQLKQASLPDSAFPLPFAAGGDAQGKPRGANPAPPPAARPRRAAAAIAPGAAPAGDDAVVPTQAVQPTTATPVDARTVLVAPTEDPRLLPGMNQQRYRPKEAGAEDATPAEKAEKKAKKAEMDAKLQMFLKQRNGTP